MKVEMAVGLKIPDTTARTALQTMRKLGHKVEALKRYDYYMFDVDGSKKGFKQAVSDVDVLVNANKNFVRFLDEKRLRKGETGIIVQDDAEPEALLHTLRERLGLDMIKHLEKGTLWVMDSKGVKIKNLIYELLANPHYQQVKILRE
ncbi:MAG: hypothetical protein KJ709_00310 [Nanoarchaeota archaeon]|nr:hypothetical protein [Nanoarchaeota archaeon]